MDELHATVATRLSRDGQRYTTKRRALVDAIAAAPRPMTTAELLAAQPSLPQSTAYRNLVVLENAGVIQRVLGSDDFARYELSEELGGHHHHLVCIRCGAVEDFTPPPRFERGLAAVIDDAATATGFSVEGHRLDVLGTCATCTS